MWNFGYTRILVVSIPSTDADFEKNYREQNIDTFNASIFASTNIGAMFRVAQKVSHYH